MKLPEMGFGGSWKLQNLVLCALEQHSPSLTPRGGKLRHKTQPVSPGLCSAPHVQGPCPAHVCVYPEHAKSFHSS